MSRRTSHFIRLTLTETRTQILPTILLAERWQDIVCDECGGADLTGDGRVMGEDLGEMAYNWLAPLEISQMPPEKSDF